MEMNFPHNSLKKDLSNSEVSGAHIAALGKDARGMLTALIAAVIARQSQTPTAASYKRARCELDTAEAQEKHDWISDRMQIFAARSVRPARPGLENFRPDLARNIMSKWGMP